MVELVDVVGVGNAIVDVIAQCDDAFVAGQGLTKGSMNLIDDERSRELYELVGPAVEASGGCVANTTAGVLSFGGSASFIGKVSGDRLGDLFGDDMRANGVGFNVPPALGGPATAQSLILVTPDAQRTMNTHLGISNLLEPDDIDPLTAQSGRLLFCEGYLWDVESAKQAIRTAMKYAKEAGRLSALTLSDTFCVERHHSEFRHLVAESVDLLFANQAELATLYGTDDLDAGVGMVGADVDLACVTLGERGSLIIHEGDVHVIDPVPVADVVDTTGAGDQYAAGVLYGLARGLPLSECGRLGSVAASEVISHFGPRPLVSLRDLAGPSVV